MSFDAYINNSQFLTADDFAEPRTVAIEGFETGENQFTGMEQLIVVLEIGRISLNQTRLKDLKTLFGAEEADAVGKVIEVYTEEVEISGEVKKAIRFRQAQKGED